jgi:hypothetical protein
MLAVLLVADFVAAVPASQQPEALTDVRPDWDAQAGVFMIGFRTTANFAERAETAGHVLVTTLTIEDRAGSPLTVLGPQADPIHRVAERTAKRGNVRLEPQVVPWDRLEGTFTGVVVIHLRTEVQTSDGASVQLILNDFRDNITAN